jgi:hypothetical protein
MLDGRACSSMQFIHRWSSVAYHTIILPFQTICASAHALHIIFTIAMASIVHNLVLSSRIHTPPYRTSFPSHAKIPKLIMVQLPETLLPSIKYSFQDTTTLHPSTSTSTPLQMSQVLPASRVPRRHVLLHAVCESGLLGRGNRRAGVGDRALEAVFVDFL